MTTDERFLRDAKLLDAGMNEVRRMLIGAG